MNKKKIIIIGGTGAIGSSLAKEITNHNLEPILIARNRDNLELLSNELNCNFFTCDILDTNNLKKIIQDLGDIVYGLAYCVGSINLKPLRLTKEEDFIDSFKINTLGAINSIKFAQPSLAKNKGSILLFSTIAVKQGFINHSIISTAKGGIEGLTLSLAAELAPTVRVNCIAPSLTVSNMSKNLIQNDKIRKAIEDMHPIPKIGVGKDFAHMGAYLLSEQNEWITGQILHIDGGRSSLRIKA